MTRRTATVDLNLLNLRLSAETTSCQRFDRIAQHAYPQIQVLSVLSLRRPTVLWFMASAFDAPGAPVRKPLSESFSAGKQKKESFEPTTVPGLRWHDRPVNCGSCDPESPNLTSLMAPLREPFAPVGRNPSAAVLLPKRGAMPRCQTPTNHPPDNYSPNSFPSNAAFSS